jgi:hypothetical protein
LGNLIGQASGKSRKSAEEGLRASKRLILVASVLTFLFAAGATRSAGQETPSVFKAFTPAHVVDGTATLVGHYNPNQNLRLALALQPPHWAEEQQFLKDLQTKGSPQFHQFLSEEDWNARFSPSVADEQAVVDWAKSQGMEVTHRYPNRLIVDIVAPAATLEKAFGVTLNSYQSGTLSFFSNDRDPQLPVNLQSIVQAIIGLNNWERMHPSNKNMAVPAVPDFTPGPVVGAPVSAQNDGDGTGQPLKIGTNGAIPSITGGAYDPTDIYSSEAYNYNALYNQGHCCNPLGASSSPPEASIDVATVGAQNFNDILGFHNQYPYLSYNLTEIPIDGQSVPCTDPTDASCDGEGTLDMEWTTATANSFGSYTDTAHVYMYDNSSFWNFHDSYNQMLSDGYARVATTSWSCTEFLQCSTGYMDSLNSVFSNMVGRGWTLVAAQGDRGATDDVSVPAVAVAFPGSNPNVVSAGGTTLRLNSSSDYVSEVTWTGGPAGAARNDGGTGGGCSAYYQAPPYQSNQPCGPGSRGVPDIALNADWYNTPQNIYANGLGGNGGTSIVAPELAGFFAQENAYLLSLGNICGSGSSPCAPMGNIDYFLYEEGISAGAPHYPFYDITSGCNNNDLTALYGLSYFCAGPGWDAVTGWGSANMLQLAWAVNWYHVPGYSYPSVMFYGPATHRWYNTDQVVSWTVSAPSFNSYPSDGVAGFSQAWDSDPGNPYGEPTPGSGNSFYSGPQYPNATNGCLDFTGAYCAGSVGQGWHTVNVRAWGNEGENGGDYTYGPVGYDTIPPHTSATLSGPLVSGTTYKGAVTVTLTANDPGYPSGTGSGVASTVYQINSEGLLTYGGPFTIAYSGSYTVTFYSTDFAGNVEATETKSFSIRPVISVSPSSLSFGNQLYQTTSASQTLTLTNNGSSAVAINSASASGDFSVPTNNCPASLGGGLQCMVTVNFTPSVSGAITGDATLVYAGEGSPLRVSLSGTGLAPMSVSPASLAFGSLAVGSTSGAQAVTLTNNETSSLNIASTVSGDYSISPTTCGSSLAGSGSCTMMVTFSPEQNGTAYGAVTVTYGASLSPLVVALTGNGTGGSTSALTFSPSPLSFSKVVVGTSASLPVTVKNTSASPVSISAISASGDYSTSGCVTTLTHNATCVMTVTFSPSVIGATKGSVALSNTSAVSPEIYNVSGTGVSPLSLSTTSVNFGTVSVGAASFPSPVTLTNNSSSATLNLTLGASGDYLVAGGTCGATLGPLASCAVTLEFSPTATGTINGIFTVGYGSTFTPEEVKLTGVGN